MGRTLIESIDASMSEMFRCHDYRNMYDYYEKIIRPIIAEREQKLIKTRQKCTLVDVSKSIDSAKATVAFGEWLRSQRPDVFWGHPTTEQLYESYKKATGC